MVECPQPGELGYSKRLTVRLPFGDRAVKDGFTLLLSPVSGVPINVVGTALTSSERLRAFVGQVLALAILGAVSPLMVLIAWVIRLDGGPATFGHYRVG